MKFLISFIALVLLFSCLGENKKKAKTTENPFPKDTLVSGTSFKRNGLPEINLKEKYPGRRIDLQEVADIEYIPMETKDNVLLGPGALNKGTFMSDSLIITCDSDGGIFVFNREGKNLYAFNHTGRGPEEYQFINCMAVDFIESEIYVCDYVLRGRIHVFSFDGSYKRVLKLPHNYWIMSMLNYDNESLLCYEGYGAEGTRWKGEKFNKQPYALLSKKDGRITPLALKLSKRVSSSLTDPDHPGVSFSLGEYPLIKNGSDFLISDLAQDTIFRLKGTTLTPYLLKTPASLWKLQIPVVARLAFATQRFTTVESIVMQLKDRPVLYTYAHQTGEIFRPIFINTDYEPGRVLSFGYYSSDLPLNYVRQVLSVTGLLKDYAAGKLRGELKEIASRLNEDDNPVLMLVKFKE